MCGGKQLKIKSYLEILKEKTQKARLNLTVNEEV